MASSLTDVHILFVDPNGDNVRLINMSPVASYTWSITFFPHDARVQSATPYPPHWWLWTNYRADFWSQSAII